MAVDALSVDEMEQRLAEFSPDLIHGFHAGHCGAITRRLAEDLRLPYVITFTGSDIHDPHVHCQPESLESARAAVCFGELDAGRVGELFPQLKRKVAVIPQGIEPPAVVEGENFGLARDRFVLLLPAALRPVKQVEFPILALEALLKRIPSICLVIAGGIIDHDYAGVIKEMLCRASFALWPGEVPNRLMGSLYNRADLVLNCSLSESMPNSLLEAMALGRPVLAADISGNRPLIIHGQTGWLYNSERHFQDLVIELAGDSRLRSECGKRARDFILERHSPVLEAERHLALYRSICASRQPAP